MDNDGWTVGEERRKEDTKRLKAAEKVIRTLQFMTVNAIDPQDFEAIRTECDKCLGDLGEKK